MKHTMTRSLVCLVMFSFALAARGDLVIREAADFQGGAYEANLLPDAAGSSVNGLDSVNWNRSGSGGTAAVDSGVLNLNTATDQFRHYNSAPGGVNWWLGDYNTGYTVEARLRVISNTDESRGVGVFGARDGSVEGLFDLGTNWISWGSGAVPANRMAVGQDNATDFITLRLAKLPGEDIFYVWRNNVLLADNLSPSAVIAAHYLMFGDTSTARYGGEVEYDYIRWDTTGAYGVIPEPSQVALLVLGAALLGSRARRKQS